MNSFTKIASFAAIAATLAFSAQSASAVSVNLDASAQSKGTTTTMVTTNVTTNVIAADTATVKTSDDLTVFTKAFKDSDKNVSKVDAEDDNVTLWYKDHAKFLGFIPMTVSAKATVKADGTTEVRYPWYRFLTTYDDAKLQANLDSNAGVIARAEGSTQFSASAKARILSAMRATMKSHYEATADASASASTN